MHEATDDGDLLAKMSPLLQGTVAVAANREWLGQIWFLHGMGNTRLEKEFVAALAMRLNLSAYIMHERARRRALSNPCFPSVISACVVAALSLLRPCVFRPQDCPSGRCTCCAAG